MVTRVLGVLSVCRIVSCILLVFVECRSKIFHSLYSKARNISQYPLGSGIVRK